MPKKTVKKPTSKKKTPAKRSAKPTVTVERKQTLMDKLPKTEIEHLELMLFYTERAIPARGGGRPDQGMINQAERIKLEIEKLKKAV